MKLKNFVVSSLVLAVSTFSAHAQSRKSDRMLSSYCTCD